MSDRILVATRKGLLTLGRNGSGWSVSKTDFPGIPITNVLRDARDGAIYAALKHGHFGSKLHRSDDGGNSWKELPAPAFPADAAGSPSLFQIWTIEAGGSQQPGRLWIGALPAGIHTVLPDPRDARRIFIAISCGGVWETRDDGASWKVHGKGLIASYMPPEQAEASEIQDPHRVARSAGAPDMMWMQHHSGIFRSTDAGLTWSQIKPPGDDFGFAVAAHPKDGQMAWFVPAIKDELRMPRDGVLAVTRTRDGGKTFEKFTDGLPQRDAFDLIYRHGLDIDATGSHLAMGSTTGALWVSDNGGEKWQLANAHLPPIYAVRLM